MTNIIIRVLDLPTITKGFVREDFDGDYNVYINAKFNEETQAVTLKHELKHIIRRDLDNDWPLAVIEDC